jgi:hypothetical protein
MESAVQMTAALGFGDFIGNRNFPDVDVDERKARFACNSTLTLILLTAIGKGNGMKDETLSTCRLAGSSDPKIDAMLKFAAAVVRERGAVTSEAFQRAKYAGCSDEQILEIVANVALFIFANYVNLVIGTEVDFPLVAPMKPAAAVRASSHL